MIQGEYVETLPTDPFETVKARRVSGDERQVTVSWGRRGALVCISEVLGHVNISGHWRPM